MPTVNGIGLDLDPIGYNSQIDFSELKWVYPKLVYPIRFIVDTKHNNILIDTVTYDHRITEQATNITEIINNIKISIDNNENNNSNNNDSNILDRNKQHIDLILDNTKKLLNQDVARLYDKIHRNINIVDYGNRKNLLSCRIILYSGDVISNIDRYIFQKIFWMNLSINDVNEGRNLEYEYIYNMNHNLFVLTRLLSHIFSIQFIDKSTIKYNLINGDGNIQTGTFPLFSSDDELIKQDIMKHPTIYSKSLYQYLYDNNLYFPISFIIDVLIDLNDLGYKDSDINNTDNYNMNDIDGIDNIDNLYKMLLLDRVDINDLIQRQQLSVSYGLSSKIPLLYIDSIDIDKTVSNINAKNTDTIIDFVNNVIKSKYPNTSKDINYNIDNLSILSIDKIYYNNNKYKVFSNAGANDDYNKIFDLLIDEEKRYTLLKDNKLLVSNAIHLMNTNHNNININRATRIDYDVVEIHNSNIKNIIDLFYANFCDVYINYDVSKKTTNNFESALRDIAYNSPNISRISFIRMKLNNIIVGNVLYLFHKNGTNKITTGGTDYYYDIIAFIKRIGAFSSFPISPEEPYVIKAKRDLSGNPLSGSIAYILVGSDDPNESVKINNRTIMVSIAKALKDMIYDTVLWAGIDNDLSIDPELLLLLNPDNLYDDVSFIHTITQDIFQFYDRFGITTNANIPSNIVSSYYTYNKHRFEININTNDGYKIYKSRIQTTIDYYDGKNLIGDSYIKSYDDYKDIKSIILEKPSIHNQLIIDDNNRIRDITLFNTPFGWYMTTDYNITETQKVNVYIYSNDITLWIENPVPIYEPTSALPVYENVWTNASIQDTMFINVVPYMWYNLSDTYINFGNTLPFEFSYDRSVLYIENNTNYDTRIMYHAISGFDQNIRYTVGTIPVPKKSNAILPLADTDTNLFRSFMIALLYERDYEEYIKGNIRMFVTYPYYGFVGDVDVDVVSKNIKYDKDFIYKVEYNNQLLLSIKREISDSIMNNPDNYDYPVFSFSYLNNDFYNMLYHIIDPIKPIYMDRPYTIYGRTANSPYYIDDNIIRIGNELANKYGLNKVHDPTDYTSSAYWFMQINMNHVVPELLYVYTNNPAYSSFIHCLYNNNNSIKSVNRNRLLSIDTWITNSIETGNNVFTKDKFISSNCYTIIDSSGNFVFGNKRYKVVSSDKPLDGYQASIVLYPIPLYKNISYNDNFPLSIQFVRDDRNKQAIIYIFYPVGMISYFRWRDGTNIKEQTVNYIDTNIVSNDMDFFIDDVYYNFVKGKSNTIMPNEIYPLFPYNDKIRQYLTKYPITTQYNHVFDGNGKYWYSGANRLSYVTLWYAPDRLIQSGIGTFLIDLFNSNVIKNTILQFNRTQHIKDKLSLQTFMYDKRYEEGYNSDVLFFFIHNTLYGIKLEESVVGALFNGYNTKFVTNNVYMKEYNGNKFDRMYFADIDDNIVFLVDYSTGTSVYYFNVPFTNNLLYPIVQRRNNIDMKLTQKNIIDNIMYYIGFVFKNKIIKQYSDIGLLKFVYIDEDGNIYDGLETNKWFIAFEDRDSYDYIDISDITSTKVITNTKIKSIVSEFIPDKSQIRYIANGSEHINKSSEFYVVMGQNIYHDIDIIKQASDSMFYFGEYFVYEIDNSNFIVASDTQQFNITNTDDLRRIMSFLQDNDKHALLLYNNNNNSIRVVIDYERIMRNVLVNEFGINEQTIDDYVEQLIKQYNDISIGMMFNKQWIPVNLLSLNRNGNIMYADLIVDREPLMNVRPNIDAEQIINDITNNNGNSIKIFVISY